MPRTRTRLQRLIATLAKTPGGPDAGPPRDPWHAILYENVAYLCTDDARQRAFDTLRRATDLDARALATAPDDLLLTATRHGKLASQRVGNLRECAELFATVGDPRKLVDLPLPKARAALKHFPGIGDPGADRLLLFAGKAPLVVMESNGLRTLLRLGYGTETKNYAKSYRSAQAAAATEVPATTAARMELFRVMRHHGQATCRATPNCTVCAVASDCPARRGGRPD